MCFVGFYICFVGIRATFFLPTLPLPEWFHWSRGADSRSHSVGGVHGGGGRRRAEVGMKIWTREICRVYGVNGVEVENVLNLLYSYRCAAWWGLKYHFFPTDGHPPRSLFMTLVFGWRLGLVFGRWTFKNRGLFQGLPVCKNLFHLW